VFSKVKCCCFFRRFSCKRLLHGYEKFPFLRYETRKKVELLHVLFGGISAPFFGCFISADFVFETIVALRVDVVPRSAFPQITSRISLSTREPTLGTFPGQF